MSQASMKGAAPGPASSLPSRFRLAVRVSHGTFRGWVRCALGQISFLLGRLDRFTRIAPRDVNRLVFVCLGNINRSAFGGAVATKLGARCVSVGLSTSTGTRAPAQAVCFASGFDVALTDHAATSISDYVYAPGDLLLVMEIRHIQRLIDGGFPADAIALLGHWSSPHRIHLHDPHTLSDDYYRTCFALIHSAVHKLVDELACHGSACVARRAAERRA